MIDRILQLGANKEYSKVIELAATLTPSDCESGDAASVIGKAYEKNNLFSAALDWYKREYELIPTDSALGEIMGMYFAMYRYAEAKAFLDGLQSGKNDYYYLAAQYEIALRTGASSKEQAECLKQFLDIQYEETYMLRLAALYTDSKQEKEAARACRKVVRLSINSDAALYAQGLHEALKNGNGSEYLKKKPWLEDAVFKHISFIPDEISSKESVIGGTFGAKKDNADEALRLKKDIAELSATASVDKGKGKKDADIKKDKIAPIVEKSMESVVGMGELRRLLNSILNLIQAGKKRSEFSDVLSYNLVILGPDGCGKTTAAYAACRALFNLGVIGSATPILAEYDSLIGDKPEETHDNVEKLFESAENSCILIDNIHEFDDAGAYSQGLEVIDQLVKAYNEANGTIPFIITGAEAEVNELLKKKKSLRSLFNLPFISLGRYTNDELVEIAKKISKGKGLLLSDEAIVVLKKKLEHISGQPDFMYSNDIERLLNNVYIKLADRLSKKRRPSGNDYFLITAEDFGEPDEAETVEELLSELDKMTGLKEVKEQVNKMVNHVKVQKMKKAFNIKDSENPGTLHLVFVGNAGTGKTTVARIIGQIYKRLGVLPSGQLIECTRRDLVSQYVGATAPLVRQKIKEAMGGILFIDEAYTLCKDDNDTYGKEAIDALLTDIENHRDSFMVILAGYADKMDEFMDQNQGLRSRIPTKITFEDYTVDEMTEIFKRNIKKSNHLLDVGLDDSIKRLIETKSKEKDFGNARGIRNITDEVFLNMNNRISSIDASSLSKNDFLIVKEADLRVENSKAEKTKSVSEYLDELDSLIGLNSVKKRVREIVASVDMNKKREALGLGSNGLGTLHMVFKGNAGTGKTTVARIISNIYKSIGVLKTGGLKECGRNDLVAGYLGQTASKTKDVVREAIGGVLFIDEAYALAGDAFGKEAINTLVADIENYRDELVVIIAGYSEDMDLFMSENQGLSSRFPNEIVFEDYTIDEMYLIFRNILNRDKRYFDEALRPLIVDLISRSSQKAQFGNARGVRNLIDKVKTQQDLRLNEMSRSGATLTAEDFTTILESDILLAVS